MKTQYALNENNELVVITPLDEKLEDLERTILGLKAELLLIDKQQAILNTATAYDEMIAEKQSHIGIVQEKIDAIKMPPATITITKV